MVSSTISLLGTCIISTEELLQMCCASSTDFIVGTGIGLADIWIAITSIAGK